MEILKGLECNIEKNLKLVIIVQQNCIGKVLVCILFYECCVESNKLTMPQMPYIDERGHTILLGNGLGSEFSGS